MAIYKLEDFLRHYAPRPNQSIAQTPVTPIANLYLPKSSVLHYVPLVSSNAFFDPSMNLIKNWPAGLRHTFVRDPQLSFGSVRRLTVSLSKVMQDYYRVTPAVRRLVQLQRGLAQKIDMVILDYSLIPRMAVYAQNQYARLWYFENLLQTVVHEANQIDQDRPQIIPIQLTSNWMGLAQFKQSLETLTAAQMERYQDQSLLWVLEVMRFLNGSRTLLNNFESDNVILEFQLGLFSVTLPMGRLKALREKQGDQLLGLYNLLSKLHQRFAQLEDADEEDHNEEDLPVSAAGATNAVTNNIEEVVPKHIQARLEEQVRAGVLKASQMQRYQERFKDMAALPDPVSGQPLQVVSKPMTVEELQIPTDLNVPVENKLVPEQALKSSVTNYVTSYPKKYMQRHIASVIYALRNAGVVVRNYDTEVVSDALEDRQVLHISIEPINGRPATFKVDLPVIQKDGTFTLGGVHYTMNTQVVDQPIRKTKANQAALTSYAGKIFIQRSELAKHDFNRWLGATIRKVGVMSSDKRVTELRLGGFTIPNLALPRPYSALMKTITSFVSGDYFFDFNYADREKTYGTAAIRSLERDGAVVCGTYKGRPIAMTRDGHLIGEGQNGIYFLDALGGSFGVPPSDIAVFKSLNRRIPVIMFLGYLNGLTNVVNKLHSNVRYEPIRQRPAPEQGEIFVNFADERMYIKITNPVESMIWSGLKDMEAQTKLTNIADFNKRDGWIACLDLYNANVGHLKNWEQMNDMFLDPITINALEIMHEPTNMQDLFIRCVELIQTDGAPRESDTLHTRFRGLERIPGALYKALYDAVAAQRKSPNPANEQISLPRNAIIQAINNDSAVQLVSEINPTHNLKEQESVTKAGTGGRTAQTLVKRNRIFDQNDLGILSENTPDSAKVGIRGYFTPNAAIGNMLGFPAKYDPKVGASGFLSTTALTLPGMDQDDKQFTVVSKLL